MKPIEFFEHLEEVCADLNIEDRDCETLTNFRAAYIPKYVQQQVYHVNQALLSSYLVYDPITQDFRLYKGIDDD